MSASPALKAAGPLVGDAGSPAPRADAALAEIVPGPSSSPLVADLPLQSGVPSSDAVADAASPDPGASSNEPPSNELVVFALGPGEKEQWVLGSNVARLLGFNRGALYARYPMMTVQVLSSVQKEYLLQTGVVPVRHPKMAVLLKVQVEELVQRFYPSRTVTFYNHSAMPARALAAAGSPRVRAKPLTGSDAPARAKRRRMAASAGAVLSDNDSDADDDDDAAARKQRARARAQTAFSAVGRRGALSALLDAGDAAPPAAANESHAWHLNDIHLAHSCTHCVCSFGTRRGLRTHLLLSHLAEPSVL